MSTQAPTRPALSMAARSILVFAPAQKEGCPMTDIKLPQLPTARR